MKKEKCEICNMPTGRAGRADDSIICEKCDKVICKDCIGKEHKQGVITCIQCCKEIKGSMRTEKEIREEMERVKKAKKQSQSPGAFERYNQRYWTLRWVLGEEE